VFLRALSNFAGLGRTHEWSSPLRKRQGEQLTEDALLAAFPSDAAQLPSVVDADGAHDGVAERSRLSTVEVHVDPDASGNAVRAVAGPDVSLMQGVASEPVRTISGRCIAGDLGSQGSPGRRCSPGGRSRTTSLHRDFANHLTQRQQAALDVIAARHPRPVSSAQLATELKLSPGALNVTLRSLQRRQLIVAVPATAQRRGGWVLWPRQ
jgi:hypothetical protein